MNTLMIPSLVGFGWAESLSPGTPPKCTDFTYTGLCTKSASPSYLDTHRISHRYNKSINS